MKMYKFFFILFLSFLTIQLNAQTRKSLNYYAEDVLRKIEVTPSQKEEIKSIREELDRQLSEIKNNLNLKDEEKSSKNKQVYNEAYVNYNKVLAPNQKVILKKLLFEVQAENVKNGLASFHESGHFKMRMEAFSKDPLVKNGIVFLGNSITERGNWAELITEKKVFNRGIGGDNTYGVLARLEEIIKSEPEKVFLMIGINDIGSRQWETSLILKNYTEIVDKIRKGTPKTKLYIQSVLPLNDALLKGESYKNKADTILNFNKELQKMGKATGSKFVDVYSVFHSGDNILKTDYTKDGIHLLPDAYKVWVDYLRKNKYL